MTNTEYEKASVEAALGKRKLAAVDAKITETEQALVYLLHQRREIVNQYDLNKDKPSHLLRSLGAGPKTCQHDFERVSIAGLGCVSAVCRSCGMAK